MPLRRTQRSDGRLRPRWKDGSHDTVESTHANESRCDEIVLEPNRQTEPLVTVPPLLKRNHERKTYFPHRRRFFDPGVCSRSSYAASS